MAENQQIGWSQEAILLREVLRQLEQYAGILYQTTSATTTASVPADSSVWTQEAYDATLVEAQASYTRPTDWLPMPVMVDGDKKLAILHRVDNVDGNFVAFTISGDYTVDWGDSIVENFTAGTTAQHKYNWNSVSAATLTSDGFRQTMIIVTPQGAANLTNFTFNLKHSQAGLTTYTTGYLSIKVASQQCTAFSFSSLTPNVYMRGIREFEWVGSHLLTSGTQMFYNCFSLEKVSLGISTALTGTNQMFFGCSALKSVALFDTSQVTTATNMFFGCVSLVTVPPFNFAVLTDATSLLQNCSSLKMPPFFLFPNLLNATAIFNGCTSLTSVPALSFPKTTNANNLFITCSALVTVPVLSFPLLTNASSMFSGCILLEETSAFIFGALTNTGNMFFGCTVLRKIAVFDTSLVTDCVGMFRACKSLVSLPAFNLPRTNTVQNLFWDCISLESLPSNMFNIGTINAPTNCNATFNNCYSLKSVPLFYTGGSTNANNMFTNCYNLAVIPPFNFTSVTSFTSTFDGCSMLADVNIFAVKASISFPNSILSKAVLEKVFNNLASNVLGPSISINGNWGASGIWAAFSKPSTGITTNSTAITVADTSSLVAGMVVTGTGISGSITVNLDGTPDTVTLTNHGLPNGKTVYFFSTNLAVGVPLKTPLYVINSTTNTFQISLTSGGAPINITGDTQGAMDYHCIVTVVTAGVGCTLDVPVKGTTSSITATFRLLNTQLALSKGWGISG